jgi:uncharacterized protein (TIGR03437 family)
MNFLFKLVWQNRAGGWQRAALTLMALLCGVGVWLLPVRYPAAENSKARTSPVITRANAAERLAKLPLAFEADRGPGDSAQRFTARGQQFTLCLAESEAALVKPSAESKLKAQISNLKSLRLRWLAANPHPALEGLAPLPGKSNYFIGADPRQWRTDVPSFARVRYRQLYPGIDLIFYGGSEDQRQLEYDFLIAPHADPRQIKLAFSGVGKLELADNGDLLLHTGDEIVRQRRPVAYQMTAQGRAPVTADYVINNGQIGFRLGPYDHDLPLVIDPLILYSSYLGGSSTDIAYGIAVDREGNIYLTGQTFSPNFPVKAPFDTMLDGANDAFVMKLDPTGTRVLFSTYIGGRSSNDRGLGIAVDNGENVYFVGETSSLNFPTVNAAQAVARGNGDGFAVKLNTSGNVLLYSTYLGGGFSDVAYAVALDRFDNAYITGRTDSTNFPTRNPIQAALRGQRDAFVLRLDPDGALVASTYLGGTPAASGARDDEAGYGIAVDRLQNVYVAGFTASANFPNVNALQSNFGGVEDGFVAKLDLSAARIIYSTFLGGARGDRARGIAGESFCTPYVTGYTFSADFPVKNALQANIGGAADAFITKLNSSGASLVYSTFLGGSEDENTGLISDATPVGSIFVDALGYAFVTGKTASPNFPVVRALQAGRRGDDDAFLAKLDPAGSALVFSSYFGTSFTGNNGFAERGLGLAVDSGGLIYVTGQVLGTDLFTLQPLQNKYNGGLSDAFILKVGTSDIVSVAPVSAASFNGAQLASEGIVALFGSALATEVVTANTLPLPTNLQGTSVKVTDKTGTERPAPLFFVSPNQINLQIPPGTAPGAATITITRPQGEPVSTVAQIEATAPALFAANPTGQGVAAAIALRIKPDGAQSFEPVAQFDPVSQHFVAVPIDLGAEGDQVFLILFGTGLRNRSALEAVTVRVGGVAVQPSYVGAQGGFVGFDQVNLALPRSLGGRGELTIEMTVDGLIANAVSVAVR